MEGWLWKKGEKGLVKGWKHRFFRQHKDQLIYYKSDVSQEPLGVIPLDEGKNTCFFVSSCSRFVSSSLVYAIHPAGFKDKEHTFQISTEQRIFYLQAENEDQFHYWSLGLSAHIKRSGTQDRLMLKQIEETNKEKGTKSSISPGNSIGLTLNLYRGRNITKKNY